MYLPKNNYYWPQMHSEIDEYLHKKCNSAEEFMPDMKYNLVDCWSFFIKW